ncbi:DUF305 domain-containing protein [Parvularcula sp. LCG005]|uniref:DUF305 domain-containing protein n=1 Tax=Parvularcula sp. LCG005 TaxID=3078805 RepID=UPI002941C06B|nr:DUF305 domain-containing protein [Parvularcula sp. LCG005]WOI52475.1 DUF305 domain-containing protein [Parvularcula sp. LCG005]
MRAVILLSSTMLLQPVALTPAAMASSAPPIMQPGPPGTASQPITVDESLALGRTSYSAADVAFMQHMIVHHAQAVEMVALISERTTAPQVVRMGERISLSQATEMAFMQQWLETRGEPVAMPRHAPMMHAPKGHEHHKPGMDMTDPMDTPLMPGMLSPRQMMTLEAASGTAFDRLFLAAMIQHHEGALGMVHDLLATPNGGEDPDLSEFLTAVIADQSAEIIRMKTILSAIPDPAVN